VSKRVLIYARVSTTQHGQDVELQLSALRQVAKQRGWVLREEFVDKGVSGSVADRPALDRLMEAARQGQADVVMVWKFDRFARSTTHLLDALEEFRKLGIDFVSVRESVDTTTPIGKMVFTLLAAIGEFEAELIRERVRAGIERAKAKGVKLGRPRVEFDLRPARALLDQGHSLRATAEMLKVNRNTLRRRLRESGSWPGDAGSESSSSATV